MEDGLTLSLPNLMRLGAVIPGKGIRGVWGWRYGDDEPHSKIGYHSDLRDHDHAKLTLDFSVSGHGVKQTIQLTATKPNFGGQRWWFVCPNDGTRATKLYLPPGQQTFACRKAYGLTYQSCRESGQFRSLYKLLGAETGIDPKNVERLMKNGF